MINEHIAGGIVFDVSNNQVILPALNVSNNFATIECDAHINKQIDYTINQVFRSMTVQELNTLHAVCELEQNQHLTTLQCQYKTLNMLDFL